MEAFGRYIAIMIVMIVLFFVPVVHYNTKLLRICGDYAEEYKNEFIEMSMQSQEITLTDWNAFNKKIGALRGRYDVSLSVGTRKAVYHTETECIYGIYELRYEPEIISELHRNGRYPLEKGEYVMVEVSKSKL